VSVEVDNYNELGDVGLAGVASHRAALLDCVLEVSETAGGFLAQFSRDDVAGRVVVRSAEGADRRTAVVALLRLDDLERWER
jgi:protein involved in polysaccharide export with SLBB domain